MDKKIYYRQFQCKILSLNCFSKGKLDFRPMIVFIIIHTENSGFSLTARINKNNTYLKLKIKKKGNNNYSLCIFTSAVRYYITLIRRLHNKR